MNITKVEKADKVEIKPCHGKCGCDGKCGKKCKCKNETTDKKTGTSDMGSGGERTGN